VAAPQEQPGKATGESQDWSNFSIAVGFPKPLEYLPNALRSVSCPVLLDNQNPDWSFRTERLGGHARINQIGSVSDAKLCEG